VTHNIIESDFNKKLSSTYQLSILVGTDSWFYFAFDGADNALLLKSQNLPEPAAGKTDLKTELKSSIEQEDLFSYLYRRVKIALPTTTAAVVPDRLYNEAEKSTYLQEQTNLREGNAVMSDEIPELGVKVVYEADPALMSLLKKKFPTARFYSSVTPFLLGCRQLAKEDEQAHTVLVNLVKDVVQIFLFEKQQLHFFNAFPISSASDVLYFTMLTYQQFSLDPATVPLYLSGQVMENSEIYKMLYRYVGNLKFVAEFSFLKFNKRFSEVPQHFYFGLYSLTLCK
jgi:hypothetical protein